MWTRVAITPSADHLAPALSAAMFAAGAEGLQELERSLITHLPPACDARAFVESLRRVDPALHADVAPIEDIDWSVRWRDRLTSHRLGPLIVSPPWLAEGLDPATTVVIEPAMAFGTGDHPTTRGVVRLMAEVIRGGETVADLGAGSAVLSIAAVKLGAGRVFAIEFDHDSIGNAEENVERNGASDRIAVLEGDAALLLPLVAPVGIIFANIISSVLLELLPAMAAALGPGGRAILSGILTEERERMLEALQVAGWRVEGEDVEDPWWSVRLAR